MGHVEDCVSNLNKECNVKKFKSILKDDSGQGILEYVVILALVIMVGLMFKDKILGFMTTGTNQVTGGAGSLFSTTGGGG
jgi:hypothetical protein